MKRVVALAIAGLISISGIGVHSDSVVHASTAQASGTPLEAVPIVRSSHVTRLTATHAGSYNGLTLDHGLQFNISRSGSVELNLGGDYTEFDGTLYYEDKGNGGNTRIAVQDVSDPTAGMKQIFSGSVSFRTQHVIKVNVRGVKLLLITLYPYDTGCCIHVDLVGAFQGNPPRQVIPSYPSPNTIIPANTSVVFLWHNFTGATAYLLRVWMVKQNGTSAVTPTTPVSLSKLVFAHTSYTWNDHGFLPGTYQYDLMPVDQYGNALASATAPIQFTIASSR